MAGTQRCIPLLSAAWQREREWLSRQPLTVTEGYLRALRWFDPPPPDAWAREVEALVSQRQRSLRHYREHAQGTEDELTSSQAAIIS